MRQSQTQAQLIDAELDRAIAGTPRPAADPATCAHRDLIVARECGSFTDDHVTIYGRCRACQRDLVITQSLVSRDRDTVREQTPAERRLYEPDGLAETMELRGRDYLGHSRGEL